MHRVVWHLVYGTIPPGLVIRHKCDNPQCFNLNHLEIGTHADNARDKMERRQGPDGWIARGEQNPRSRLTDEQVLDIRASELSRVELSIKYGISKTTVLDIRGSRSWKHLPNDRLFKKLARASGQEAA
jgi:hypothetical protein